jgi:hypothetical protein
MRSQAGANAALKKPAYSNLYVSQGTNLKQGNLVQTKSVSNLKAPIQTKTDEANTKIETKSFVSPAKARTAAHKPTSVTGNIRAMMTNLARPGGYSQTVFSKPKK